MSPLPIPAHTVPVAELPKDFTWGVATAAYQIEGGTNEGGRTASIWDTFSATPGSTLHGDTGEQACDHFHRWPEDVEIVGNLGVSAYRLSFSWTRLQPSGSGPLNPEGVSFYRALLTGLRARSVTPWVTLYHWDLPQELEDLGGWPNRDTAHAFEAYVTLVVTEFADLVGHWITINEPYCAAFLGYGFGVHAPGRKSISDAVAAGHHLMLAHGLASATIRAIAPAARIGISNIVMDFEPGSAAPEDIAATERLDAANNRFFLDPVYTGGYSAAVHALYDDFGLQTLIQTDDLALIGARTDFAAINHYHHNRVWHDDAGDFRHARETPVEPATTSFNWSVTPESLARILRRIAQEYTDLPLYVTENGASYDDYVDPHGDVNDSERVAYLNGYITAAANAGINLRGYFAWSLMDNYEWGEGYSKRFGLVFVDFGTGQRTIKLSGKWYRDLIEDHGSSHEPADHHAEPREADRGPASL